MLCPSQYRHNNSCIDQCISSCYIAYDWSVFAGCSSSYIVRLGIWDYCLSFVSGSLGTTAEFERNQRVRDIIQDMFHLGQFSIVQFISDLVGTSIRFFWSLFHIWWTSGVFLQWTCSVWFLYQDASSSKAWRRQTGGPLTSCTFQTITCSLNTKAQINRLHTRNPGL